VDEASLAALVTQGESFTIEFKGERNRSLSDRDVIEAVVCLANGQGGVVFVGVEDDGSITALRLDDLLILNQLWIERRLESREASELIQKGPNEARAALERLVERGLIEGRGTGRGRDYHLAAALYRRFGAAADYTRARGFEPYQQQQMVLQFVREHGRITRSQAAELCQIDGAAASRLLISLRRRGMLVLNGSRRTAWYSPATNFARSRKTNARAQR
jgi:ATP-dependent DNA helicase RecG